MKWIGISGSWRKTNSQVEADVRDLVRETIKNPDFEGETNQGQPTVNKNLDSKHILRVVYKIKGDIITVITFYVASKVRYEK